MNMDGGASGGAAVAGGGPAPFLLKTYEMVDDTTTDAIVSWSASRKSFVVWNPPEFARVLLPSYFKHNNFSSFIRQLNTYGFRKIDPERWEFANEDFIKDQKHLLKNIHRRKPIHSHSQAQGSTDPERAALEEEIDKLSREKSDFQLNLSEFKDQNSTAKVKLENLTPRIANMEHRQERLLTFLDKAVQNPEFVERISQKLEYMDFTAYNKKRRLLVDQSQSIQETLVNQSNKLRLELSPAVSDINLLSHSTQSSNEDGTLSPQGRTREFSKDVQARTEPFLCSDTLELSDTCASFTLKMDSSISHKSGTETQKTQHALASDDEGDGRISCLLNLTLASSSPLELNKSRDLTDLPQDIRTETSPNAKNNDMAQTLRVNNKEATPVVQNRVNDVFWEQFLTERPGCTDAEEASSSFRANHYDQQEDKRSSKGVSRNTKGMEHLTL